MSWYCAGISYCTFLYPSVGVLVRYCRLLDNWDHAKEGLTTVGFGLCLQLSIMPEALYVQKRLPE
jgi:hypothetical protein